MQGLAGTLAGRQQGQQGQQGDQHPGSAAELALMVLQPEQQPAWGGASQNRAGSAAGHGIHFVGLLWGPGKALS
jgi:hypothetical protein